MATMSQFSSLEGLLTLGEGVDIRPTLLHVLTDLYMQKAVHTHDEELHYTELALRLIESVEEPIRQLARKALQGYPAAPAAVMERLSRSQPISANAPAAAGGVLADLSRIPTMVELAEQFFAAPAEERRLILLNLHHACPPRPPRPPLPNAADIIPRIESAVLQRKPEDTAWQLERALEIGGATARRIVRDESGEAFLVAAKVIGIPTHVLHRILLFLNPTIGSSVQRVYDLAGLYTEMDARAAAWLLRVWREGELAALNEKTAVTPPAPPRLAAARPTRSDRERAPAPVRPTRVTNASTLAPLAAAAETPEPYGSGLLLWALDGRFRGSDRK
jgi:hypothetical protein